MASTAQNRNVVVVGIESDLKFSWLVTRNPEDSFHDTASLDFARHGHRHRQSLFEMEKEPATADL
jgi:hypothetical protein